MDQTVILIAGSPITLPAVNMKTLQWFVLFFCVINSAWTEFVSCREYSSPNKKYSAQFTRTDRDITLIIKNQKTHQQDLLITNLIPAVEHAQWSPDSYSLLIVQHLSGGSLATLVHDDATNGWVWHDCPPPLDIPCSYFLVGIQFLQKTARFIYGVDPPRSLRSSSIKGQQICIFDVDYETGKRTLKKLGPLTAQDLNHLSKKEKRKWNMWENKTADKEMKSAY